LKYKYPFSCYCWWWWWWWWWCHFTIICIYCSWSSHPYNWWSIGCYIRYFSKIYL